MHKRILLAGAMAVTLLAAGLIIYYLPHIASQSALQAISPTRLDFAPFDQSATHQPPINAASPSRLDSPPQSAPQRSEEWDVYRDEQYKFEIHYPKTGWALTSRAAASALPYTPLEESVNLYAARDIPTQGPVGAPITIAIYAAPSMTVTAWLSEGYATDLSKVARGGVDSALERANSFRPGVVTYNESAKNGMTIYEVGRVTPDFAIGYATFLAPDNLPYIYEISFHLPYYGKFGAMPSDADYVEQYKRILSTARFTK